jgi:hypothetical protein
MSHKRSYSAFVDDAAISQTAAERQQFHDRQLQSQALNRKVFSHLRSNFPEMLENSSIEALADDRVVIDAVIGSYAPMVGEEAAAETVPAPIEVVRAVVAKWKISSSRSENKLINEGVLDCRPPSNPLSTSTPAPSNVDAPPSLLIARKSFQGRMYMDHAEVHPEDRYSWPPVEGQEDRIIGFDHVREDIESLLYPWNGAKRRV